MFLESKWYDLILTVAAYGVHRTKTTIDNEIVDEISDAMIKIKDEEPPTVYDLIDAIMDPVEELTQTTPTPVDDISLAAVRSLLLAFLPGLLDPDKEVNSWLAGREARKAKRIKRRAERKARKAAKRAAKD